ncbi:dihydrofolate reductase [Spiroplasma helicoides]|uniref:dihydrofolate reductase n=1 Tax=Spiroplasma helicoides TaxID=216938 RepID=A0A1B3SL39_9MOLU|nr:dihydrofolate reductase [Spiroplasma helicoides]AOG60646.1 dihydrofolate reductase [Spiroplasma helicoides]
MITLVWAQSQNEVIGKEGKLPWNIKQEMQHFIDYTRGKTVLMGRLTWESLKLKPLPNRKNIVITRKGLDFEHKNLEINNNLEIVLKDFKNSSEELIIIGGKQIFDIAINFADKLVVSYIYENYDGDIFATKIPDNSFKVLDIKKFDEFEVITYERK